MKPSSDRDRPRLREAASIVLLVLAGIFAFGAQTQGSGDMLLYMTYGLNLALGNGFVDFDGEATLGRGPGFPLMLQAAYALFGNATNSAFWVVRIFCIANPVVVYLLGREFFNRRVGLGAAVLVLSSYSVSLWSYRHLDAVWPFFSLASILLLHKAFKGERLSYAVGSGLLCAASFLIKESAVVFLPLPIALFLFASEFRTRKNLLYSLLYAAAFLMVVGPGLYWTRETETIGMTRAAGLLDSGSNLAALGGLYFGGLLDHYRSGRYSLSSQFSIAPLFVVAWGFALLEFFRRGTGNKVCVACLILLTPLAAYVATDRLRAGQLVVLFLLNYLVLSFFLYSMAESLVGLLSRASSWKPYRAVGRSFALMVVLVTIFQLFVHSQNDRGGWAFLTSSYFMNGSLPWQSDSDRSRFAVSPWQPTEYGVADVVTWLQEHAAQDAMILAGDGAARDYGRMLFLESQGDLRLRDLPVVHLRYLGLGVKRPSIRWLNETYALREFEFPPRDDLLLVTRGREDDAWILFESHLLTEIDKYDVHFVVLGPHLHYLAEYFRSSDSFTSVASLRDGQDQIFQVEHEVLPSPHDVFVGQKRLTRGWLSLLSKTTGLRVEESRARE